MNSKTRAKASGDYHSSPALTSFGPARKITEIISHILTDTLLSAEQDKFKLEIKGDGSNFQLIPFSKRGTISNKNQISRVFFEQHVVWEKSVQNDAVSDGASMALLFMLNGGQLTIPSHPNTIVDAHQAEDPIALSAFVKQFLIDGYLVIEASALKTITPSFHKSMFDLGRSVKNHLTTKIPQIAHVFSDMTVKRVLTRLVGVDYNILDTTHMHLSQRGRPDQHFHKDDFENYDRPSVEPSKRLDHVMAMYYPQDTILEMGPTAIRRGTQYTCYTTDYVPDRFNFKDQPDQYEVRLSCKAGSIVFLHYEIVHRRMKNTLTDRFMMKFQFRRRNPPTPDSWCYDIEQEQSLGLTSPTYDQVPLLDTDFDPSVEQYAREIWKYLHGQQ